MKVYFTASARGIDEFGSFYEQTYEFLEDEGYTHVDETLGQIDRENFYQGGRNAQIEEYERAMKAIRDSDLVVIEVSVHSLSMGYVMHRALESGKPVIALFLKGNKPHFATIIENDKLQVIEYTKENLKAQLKAALEYAKEQVDTRFNFFVTAAHSQYLDWISKNKRVPRSVFLRNLIKEDMKQNKEYMES